MQFLKDFKIKSRKTYAKLRIFPKIFFLNRAPGLYSLSDSSDKLKCRQDISQSMQAQFNNSQTDCISGIHMSLS